MSRIIIEAIPPESMRYDTLGDWFVNEGGDLVIQVAGETLDDPETLLIAHHEMVEAALCRHWGIAQEDVDAFDMAFKGAGEPGDDPMAPYHNEHRFAMLIEHMMAHEMGLAGYGKVE